MIDTSALPIRHRPGPDRHTTVCEAGFTVRAVLNVDDRCRPPDGHVEAVLREKLRRHLYGELDQPLAELKAYVTACTPPQHLHIVRHNLAKIERLIGLRPVGGPSMSAFDRDGGDTPEMERGGNGGG